MHKYPLLCLLTGALAWGQAGTAKPAAPTHPAAQSPAKPAAPPAAGNQSVGPQTAVITIPGVCDNKPAAPGAACKTVVTRAEFDDLVQTMAPNIQPAQKKQLATQYAMALVMAHKAHEKHLDQGPKYEERLRLAKLGVLNKALAETLQEQASNISDKELQDYYKTNAPAYEETDLQRIFVPKLKAQENKDADPSKASPPTEEEAKKKEQESEEATKKLADSLRARAAAGEDFDKLQDEAYAGTGMKNKPPTKLGKVRRNGLPPDQLSVLDAKTGEVSQPIANPSGYFIYKVGERGTLPFDQVKQEISTTLSQQKLRDEMQAIQQSATPELNEKYFAEGASAPGAKPEALAKPPAATKGTDPK
jgi:peptidyl-prolyl cis-trans isomerase C